MLSLKVFLTTLRLISASLVASVIVEVYKEITDNFLMSILKSLQHVIFNEEHNIIINKNICTVFLLRRRYVVPGARRAVSLLMSSSIKFKSVNS